VFSSPTTAGQRPISRNFSPPPKYQPIGCAFAGLGWQLPNNSLHDVNLISLAENDPIPTNLNLKRQGNSGSQSPTAPIKSDDEILARALGAPSRRVLERAERLGPTTGWKDGHLSALHGFCPSDPASSPAALSLSPGHKIFSN